MENVPEKSNFLQVVFTLVPLLNADSKKECETLKVLIDNAGVSSIEELSKIWKENTKRLAETFEERVQLFLNHQSMKSGEFDTVETLVDSFQQMNVTEIKKFAQKFNLNFSSKQSAPDFEKWLSTGEKPLTKEKKLEIQIEHNTDDVLSICAPSFLVENVPKTSYFLQVVFALIPLLNADFKKECETLKTLIDDADVISIEELNKVWKKNNECLAKLAEPFEERVQLFLAHQPMKSDTFDTIETLIDSFQQMKTTEIKKFAQKFNLNLSSKQDAPDFEKWLSTGKKPLPQEEKLKIQIEHYIKDALSIRDASFEELTGESIQKIMDLANSVYQQYKVIGLRIFMNGIEIIPVGKSVSQLLNEVKSFLSEISTNRYKMKQIRDQE